MLVARVLRNAIGRFRTTKRGEPAEPGRLAFASVSSEPSLLRRLPREQARRLAEQAGTAAQALIAGKHADLDGVQARAAANRVLRVVRDFIARDEVCGGSIDDMVRSATLRDADGLGGFLRGLEAAALQPTDGTARLAASAVTALGANGVRRLEREDAERLMFAASRGAASFARGDVEVSAPDTAAGSARAALLVVGEVCAGWRTLPLPPMIAGTQRERAEMLLGLWRDGIVCAEHADGAAKRLWEDARDGHAFGAVWLLPQMLSALVEAEAELLSRDARSAAAFVLRRGAGQSGTRGAMEAARTVLFSCGQVVSRAGQDNAAVTPEAPPARAAHA